MRRKGSAKAKTNTDFGLRDKTANLIYADHIAWMKHSGIRDV